MACRRSGPMGQPLHHASTRCVRLEFAAHPASHPDQGRGSAFGLNTIPPRRFGAPQIVLGLLCLMYLIRFVVRVSISTAAPLMKTDLGLSNSQLGLAFSAFSL